jgi:hypothetical protein
MVACRLRSLALGNSVKDVAFRQIDGLVVFERFVVLAAQVTDKVVAKSDVPKVLQDLDFNPPSRRWY